MTNEPTEADVTETVEDPGNADTDMALRSEQDVDDPTGRRGYARRNPDGPPGAAGEFDDTVEEATDPDA